MKNIIFLLVGIITVILTWSCSTPKPNGIDISHHNDINWIEVTKNPNIEFIYIKATEGKHFTDNKFFENMKNANRCNIHAGAYHYFRTNVSGKEQFDNFSKALDKVNFDLIPVIDVENRNNDFSDKVYVNDQLRIFIELMEKKYKIKPIIYYGNFVAITTISATYDCKMWIRIMKYSKFIPNFTIRQIGYINISNEKIDANYCSDINKILI